MHQTRPRFSNSSIPKVKITRGKLLENVSKEIKVLPMKGTKQKFWTKNMMSEWKNSLEECNISLTDRVEESGHIDTLWFIMSELPRVSLQLLVGIHSLSFPFALGCLWNMVPVISVFFPFWLCDFCHQRPWFGYGAPL